MIILKTNLELKATFERLIRTMKEPVEWTGNFAVVGDYLIRERCVLYFLILKPGK